MTEKLQVLNAEIADTKIILEVDESYPVSQLTPKGQILVDSDSFAFIYIAEKEDEYVYIVLHKDIWLSIKKGLAANLKLYLSNGQDNLELIDWKEEMEYLIDNIEGNGNYGEEMEQAVTSVFSK
ncbi:hypothetical protein [Niallia taxi]|uniref:UPF0738 family protein n=1 Tax=Niallia taxi TaxID=2499688 RepID=UPI0011A9AB49|nr:hypothetical protein [Niallia taxi]MCT2342763.1 hypothetical protein [Niallia taxi]MDE5051016.1 hypothetical protein [Niallia taxi]MED3962444.1 hypothetical protein [Niallia taxi]WOD62521.1 hypothetical protein NQZ71_17285 [Niallia taxi]